MKKNNTPNKVCEKCKKNFSGTLETCIDCQIEELKKIKSMEGENIFLIIIGLSLIIYAVYSFFDTHFAAIDGNQITNLEAFAIFLGGKSIYYIPGIFLIIFSLNKKKK